MRTNYEEIMAMQGQEKRVTEAHEATPRFDAHVSILAEVDFKWLMAGQGWWIDSARLHRDPSYATRFLRLAMASPCTPLRDCAASLQALLDRPDEYGPAQLRPATA
jgi:hypothetical protein